MTQILRGSAAGVLRHTNTCLSCVPLARQTSTTPTSSACRAPCFHSSHHTTAHTPPDAKLRSGNGAVLRPVRSAFLVCHYANRPGLPPSSSRLNSCSPPRAQTYPPSPAPLPSLAPAAAAVVLGRCLQESRGQCRASSAAAAFRAPRPRTLHLLICWAAPKL